MAVLLLSFIQATLQGGIVGGARVQAPQSAPLTLTQIAVSPVSSTVSTGTTENYTGNGTFSDGSIVDVTDQCVWASSNTAVATIGVASNPQIVNTSNVGTSNITCRMGAVTGSATLNVSGVAITTLNLPLGIVGNPYTVSFTASGGTQPYVFSITAGLSNLTGIGLHFSDPTLSGTPTAQGNYAFTLTVHDSATPSASATYNYVLLVNQIVPPVTGGWAKLPKVWVDSHECDPPGGVYDVNKTIKNTGGDYACTMAGLNQAMLDWTSSGIDQSERVKVDSVNSPGGQCRIVGATGSGTNSQFIIRTKIVNGNMPTKCFVIESSTPNPDGTNVCAGSDNPMQMVRNFGCDNGPAKANMWYLASNSVMIEGQVIQAGPWDATTNWGVNHVVIRDAEIEALGSGSTAAYFMIDLVPHVSVGGNRAYLPRPDPRQYGSDIGIERSYIHGDSDDLTATSPGNRRINLVVGQAPAKGWLMWNYVDRIFCLSGTTACENKITQGTWVPPGLKMVGNWFEGTAITSFWGGQVGITTLVQPSDVEIRKNRYTYNPNWMPWKPGCTGTVTSCAVGGGQGRKNPVELKTGLRFLFNGNVFEYSHSAAQYGQQITFNTRASSAGLWSDNYNVEISDMTVTNNVLRHSVNGIQMDGRSDGVGAGQGQAWPARRWSFINNLFYNIGATSQVPGGNSNGYGSAVSVFGGGASGQAMGVVSLQRLNGIARVVMANGGTGRQKARISAGDAVAVISCKTATEGADLTSFNTPNPSTSIGPNATADTTDPDGLTVSYPNAGPDTGVLDATGAGCSVINRQGFPEFMTYSHNTVITVTQAKWPNNAVAITPVPNFMRHSTYQDNLMATSASNFLGWAISGSAEGNASAKNGWDINTLTVSNMTWPYRYSVRGNYTEWNPKCVADNNCRTGGSAGTTLWFPAGTVCPNATVGTSDCYGFVGMMNGVPFLGNSSNPFVDYSLVPDSPYRAGGAREAHDHTDMGAHFSEIQKAMTETKYSGCSTVPTDQNYCGPTGSFPD